MKSLLATLRSYVFPDNRSDREKEEEKQFIEALNQLKTLTVKPQGKMSIDPEEIRDQILFWLARIRSEGLTLLSPSPLAVSLPYLTANSRPSVHSA